MSFCECHIQPNWLFIYVIEGESLILIASRTDTHSNLLSNS
ncbi:MAG: type II toxin-antitoxin system YafQ family toxin [Lachnospiraceae bacterium]|nr:type II toxin-antitoxin system YafQ family toxin [Lachnospiraceae bacterium]